MADRGAFLAVVDDTPESRLAMRYAARRAHVLGAPLVLLRVVPRAGFMQWGGVQEAMDAEALAEGEALLAGLAAELGGEVVRLVRLGDAAREVMAVAARGVRTLVLATAAKGAPGPLVEFFSGEEAARLPCLVTLVPGAMSPEALELLAH